MFKKHAPGVAVWVVESRFWRALTLLKTNGYRVAQYADPQFRMLHQEVTGR